MLIFRFSGYSDRNTGVMAIYGFLTVKRALPDVSDSFSAVYFKKGAAQNPSSLSIVRD